MKYSVKIPKNINIYCNDNKIYFEGKFGTEVFDYSPFEIKIIENKLEIKNISNKNLEYCQTLITLIQQLIKGVLSGYKQQLKLIGIGFKCKVIENKLELKLGFSHLIYKEIPNFLKVSCIKSNIIVIKGTNPQKINEFISVLQHFKYPEPYKGKGIFLKNQKILRKQGKKT